MKSLKALGEFGLIREIRKWAGPLKRASKGIGDDAAVLPFTKGRKSVLTTDCMVERVHFQKRAPAQKVGWKAMAVNVSDLAAMGAKAQFAVVSLVVPRWVNSGYLRELYRGMLKCARLYGIELVGGDTVSGAVLMISVSVLGCCRDRELVYRSGARAGDLILVTGSLGGSLRGKHLSFKPRLPESRFLVTKFRPHAMIDISDGLLQDLGHVVNDSKVGADVWCENIPISGAVLNTTRGKEAALAAACSDGEDFELLFTLPRSHVRRLEEKWREQFRTKLSVIGEMVSSPKNIRIISNGKVIQPRWLDSKGWSHF